MAMLFAIIMAALVVFQLALAGGAPWGALAWGGAHPGRLPRRLRIASAGSTVVYVGMVVLALDRGGWLDVMSDPASTTGMWVVAGILGLGVPMNLASRSRPERLVMTPVVTTLTVLAALIARG
ncbi:MAG: hypothetical protein KA190_10790 [Kofleriaceae bacterium]|nr:hypothetical protein [Kofleriaceae bacterium]